MAFENNKNGEKKRKLLIKKNLLLHNRKFVFLLLSIVLIGTELKRNFTNFFYKQLVLYRRFSIFESDLKLIKLI